MTKTLGLIHQTYNLVLDRLKNLKEISSCKQSEDEIKRMEGVVDVLKELRESLGRRLQESGIKMSLIERFQETSRFWFKMTSKH